MPVSTSHSIPTLHPPLVTILLFSMSYTRISKRFCSFFLKYREEKLSLLFPHLTLLHAMICLVHSPQTFQLFGLIEGIRSVENLKQKLWPKFFMFILSSRKRNTVNGMTPIQKLHSHRTIPSGLGRVVPALDNLGSSQKWRKQKMLQQVHNLRVVHIAGCSCALGLSSLHRGASFAYG